MVQRDLLASFKHFRQNLSLTVLRLLAYAVRALVVESTWPQIERRQWRSNVRAPAALGPLLNWITIGVAAKFAGDHVRAGRYLSSILLVAASGESCCRSTNRRCGRDGFAASARGSFYRLCQDPTAGSGWSRQPLEKFAGESLNRKNSVPPLDDS